MEKAKKQDFLLAVRKASFVTPGAFSFFVKCGENKYRGLQQASVDRQLLDSTMVRTTIKGTLADGALLAEIRVVDFRDYPITTIGITLKNPSNTDLTLDWISFLHREFCGDNPFLIDGEGNRKEIPMPPHPSSEGERPKPILFEDAQYFLCFDEASVLIRYEGVKHFHTEPCGATLDISKRALTIPANSSFALPDVTFLVCEGDKERCEALMQSYLEIHH